MSDRETYFQGPTTGKPARRFGEMLVIVQHPAFRLGFLDAQNGRGLDHDAIIDRIHAETPAGALKRLGWKRDLFKAGRFEIAQYRYEEGRLAVIEYGLRCKAWGHPDCPPRQVIDFLWERAQKEGEKARPEPSPAAPRFSADMLRGTEGSQQGLPFR